MIEGHDVEGTLSSCRRCFENKTYIKSQGAAARWRRRRILNTTARDLTAPRGRLVLERTLRAILWVLAAAPLGRAPRKGMHERLERVVPA